MLTNESCKKEIGNLFDEVENIHGKEQLRFCLSETVTSKTGNYELTLSPLVLTNNFGLSSAVKALKEQGFYPNVYMPSILQAYLQIVETRYIYLVLDNCISVISNQSANSGRLDKANSGHQCLDKIKAFVSKSQVIASRNFPVLDTLGKIVDRNLRNSIAHNDYLIQMGTSFVILPRMIRQQLISNPPKNLKTSYTFDEVNNLYQMAIAFNMAFKEEVEKHIGLLPNYHL